ncbi:MULTISPECIES: hypothetical protein [Pseudomonas]|jgi:hypothetical protein|uniref:PilZ domain-containing protein n=1 Tax=Pseudomonas proteolytica TaxID=219574 RepID=A0AAP6YJ59_9PSED|nr:MULTISPECIES: hypothetical protein [Pseudomonas]TDR42306.1 hypothetical protein EDF80_11079 [Pseudomonas brenneri]VVO28383.1 hypothetical protein PS834_04791 [Pseudomonas fluorescens]KAA8706271.1 hypothetical protein F4W61_01170 [Pseudomonas proteolytica]MBC3337386.1 hypothetical protein [Pseudomonas proteolytica]MCF5056175.1 hypothetical protein [Pseudomonas proteolytica]
MQRDTLLTQDELDFIQNMHHNPQLNVRDVSSSLTVNGGAQIRDLLTRLAAHEQVTIQAQFDNQQMTFPLQLVEDEFHALHLRLGVPSIFEDGPMIRPWRLVLEEPVALENVKGQPGALWVHEVSFKGLLVQSRGRSKPPRTFSMWFSPSGYERIAVRGTLERETARGLFAYRLSQGDVDETERLRQFILQQHRLAHPEVHA